MPSPVPRLFPRLFPRVDPATVDPARILPQALVRALDLAQRAAAARFEHHLACPDDSVALHLDTRTLALLHRIQKTMLDLAIRWPWFAASLGEPDPGDGNPGFTLPPPPGPCEQESLLSRGLARRLGDAESGIERAMRAHGSGSPPPPAAVFLADAERLARLVSVRKTLALTAVRARGVNAEPVGRLDPFIAIALGRSVSAPADFQMVESRPRTARSGSPGASLCRPASAPAPAKGLPSFVTDHVEAASQSFARLAGNAARLARGSARSLLRRPSAPVPAFLARLAHLETVAEARGTMSGSPSLRPGARRSPVVRVLPRVAALGLAPLPLPPPLPSAGFGSTETFRPFRRWTGEFRLAFYDRLNDVLFAIEGSLSHPFRRAWTPLPP